MRTMRDGRRRQRMNPSPAVEQVAGDLAVRVYFGNTTTVFTAPSTGVYRFHVWGGGGNFAAFDYGAGFNYAIPSGGSGSLSVYDRKMVKGETANVVSGQYAASTVTFADGHVVTAGRGGNAFSDGPGQARGGLGGVATGGDLNIDGTPGGGYTGGGGAGGGTNGGSAGANAFFSGNDYFGGPGAPGLDILRGGNGGSASGVGATNPGGGAAYNQPPGVGQIIVVQRS